MVGGKLENHLTWIFNRVDFWFVLAMLWSFPDSHELFLSKCFEYNFVGTHVTWRDHRSTCNVSQREVFCQSEHNTGTSDRPYTWNTLGESGQWAWPNSPSTLWCVLVLYSHSVSLYQGVHSNGTCKFNTRGGGGGGWPCDGLASHLGGSNFNKQLLDEVLWYPE